MKKIINYISSYINIAVLFIVFMLLIKIFEASFLIISKENLNFNIIFAGLFCNMVLSCFASLIVFPIFLLLRLIKNKIAIITTSIIFSVLILFESGLTIYSLTTGALLGSELFLRPLSETLQTVKASLGIFIPIILILLIISIFTFLSAIISKKRFSKYIYIIISAIIVVGFILMFGINRIQEKAKSKEPVIVNYITNKSDYCIKSLKNYINWQKREQKTNYEKIDAEKVSAFLREYPDREIIDINYPLERIDDTKNTLSPFFQKSDTPPNIVIIIAESLGREWIAPSEDAVSFAPFFDSLANSGLYWKNCLTTTPRSFGAVPAVTGSTPFGTKGFQFGIMPKHNSLFTILKNNNYQTNAFYAGQFYFDAIAEYLIEQDIDNMVSFYEDFQNNKTEFNGDFWGYNDGILIEKTISELNSGKFTNPMINLLITISSHEILESNNPYFKEAFRKIDEIISVAPKHRQDYYKERKGRIASFVFLDIQLQNFIHEYSKREDFENTIFIITGDHASGMNMKNNLSIYHVPLVIWSPLVNEHKTFSAIVSHNDIAPSLNALLRDNFNLKTPETVHWVGKSLDTSSTFQSSQKMLFLKYAREIDQILYNNYLYDNGDIYFLDEDMNLNEIEVEKDSIKKELSEKLDIFNYINKYAYLNNKLTSSSLQQQDKYIPIMEFYNEDSINITTPDSTGWSNIVLLPKTKIPKRDKEWEKIKITVSADIKFLNKIHINDYMNLYFECIGTGMNAPHYYTDGIFKSIVNEEIIINEWNELNISKIFYVENATDLEVTVYTYFDKGNMINRSVWKNLMIKIEGV